jgi:hypothetical protein
MLVAVYYSEVSDFVNRRYGQTAVPEVPLQHQQSSFVPLVARFN